MRKLMILCLWVLVLSFSALACINYAYSALETIEGDKEQIVITLPGGADNEAFLSQIDQALGSIDQDIMFRYVDLSGEKPIYKYFKTNHTPDFIKIPAKYQAILPNQGECFSTSGDSICVNNLLKIPDSYQTITIGNWYDLRDYDLSNANYFVEANQAEDTATTIQSLGFPVQLETGLNLYIPLLDPLQLLFVPSFMFVLSAMFFSFSNGKQNVLKKMEGYTTFHILKDETKKNIHWLGGSFLIIVCATLIVAAVVFNQAFIQFSLFYLNYLFVLLGVMALGGLLASIIVRMQNSAEFVKGRVPKKGMYFTTMFGKVIFLVFLIFSLSMGIRDIVGVISSTRTLNAIQEKVANYVTIPIFENNSSLSNPEENYLDFYRLTVDQHQGVLIGANNYYRDVMTGSNLSVDFGQDFITINENYLELNPIYDPTGAAITPERFSDNQYNILIPISKQDEKEKYTEWIDLWYGLEVNFIEYNSSISDIFSYNPGIGSDSLGRLDEPVILMFDESLPYQGLYIESYCSQGSYFLKTYTDEPYQELLPILEQAGISSVSLRTPYIADRFDEMMVFQLSNFRLYIIQSAFFLLGLVSLILFSVDLYCEINKQKIACSLIEGATIMAYMRPHFIAIGLTYIITTPLLALSTKLTSITVSYYLLIAAITLELIITIVSANRIANKNLYQIVKGAE
ncbi:MAG: hypothetical protein H0S79_25480 [Anaerolineaceae bacterium]|nr:hypothetical protein [Anaerolineaceae bacterium]